ncbi:phage ORF5 protein [Jeotgalibaca porci]|uniref:phage ORF5 protein n=1 Tax=Jeotgalibaca porci TaxID=1868793 RepID=UPI0035A166B2
MKNLYSVFDSLNEEFAQPFLCNNHNIAKDMFIKDVRNIAKQNLQKFSDPDISRYSLVMVGSFDLNSGRVEPVDPYVIYDVKKDFDFSIFEKQIDENNKSRGLELQGDN